MKILSHVSIRFAAIAAALIVWSGCATQPPAPVNNGPTTQMQWKQGTVTSFQKSTLDTLPGEPVVANSMTTYTSTLSASGIPLYGRDAAAIDVNVYSGGVLTPTDSSIYSQDGGNDLYEWNLGLSQGLVLFNTTLKAFGINLPNPGWALEIKMASGKGIQWIAFEHDTTVNVTVPTIPIPVGITIKEQDNGQMLADSTFALGGTNYTVKHAQHVLSFSATALTGPLLTWSETLDVFVSADLATPVLTIIHPSTLAFGALLQAQSGGSTRKTQGSMSVLVSHK